MNTTEKILKWLFDKPTKKMEEPIIAVAIEKRLDKVDWFNKEAPKLFSKGLADLAYFIYSIEAFPSKDFQFSSNHIYFNKSLNLFVSIKQAPYYTDYGFSIFIYKATINDSKMLCHIPQEIQDDKCTFLTEVADLFFVNVDILRLLRGEQWEPIRPIKFMCSNTSDKMVLRQAD